MTFAAQNFFIFHHHWHVQKTTTYIQIIKRDSIQKNSEGYSQIHL